MCPNNVPIITSATAAHQGSITAAAAQVTTSFAAMTCHGGAARRQHALGPVHTSLRPYKDSALIIGDREAKVPCILM